MPHESQPHVPPHESSGAQAKAGWYKWVFAKFQPSGKERYEAEIAPRKAALLGGLAGDVLEIGPGAGPNLRYYAPGVRWVGVEPNPYMHEPLRQTLDEILGKTVGKSVAQQDLEVDIRLGRAEALPAADNSMDAVVSTLVLCSVDDLAQTLAEVRRVLKPGGKFLFIEHVAAPRTSGLRRMQNVVRPLWQVLGDGCRPNRETWHAIEQAGFATVQIDHFSMHRPIIKPHIAGYAVK